MQEPKFHIEQAGIFAIAHNGIDNPNGLAVLMLFDITHHAGGVPADITPKADGDDKDQFGGKDLAETTGSFREGNQYVTALAQLREHEYCQQNEQDRRKE